MNPMNTPATAREPGTADVRAVGSDELARVEGGLVCMGTLYIGWADGGHVVIPLWA